MLACVPLMQSCLCVCVCVCVGGKGAGLRFGDHGGKGFGDAQPDRQPMGVPSVRDAECTGCTAHEPGVVASEANWRRWRVRSAIFVSRSFLVANMVT